MTETTASVTGPVIFTHEPPPMWLCEPTQYWQSWCPILGYLVMYATSKALFVFLFIPLCSTYSHFALLLGKMLFLLVWFMTALEVLWHSHLHGVCVT